MLHATVKYREEKTHIRELRCHRQNTKHKVAGDCIASQRGFAELSQPAPLQEGSVRTQMAAESRAQRWKRASSHWYRERCLTGDTRTCAHLAVILRYLGRLSSADTSQELVILQWHPIPLGISFFQCWTTCVCVCMCVFYVSFTNSLFASQKYGLFSFDTKRKFLLINVAFIKHLNSCYWLWVNSPLSPH